MSPLLYRPATLADLDQLYDIRFSVLENQEPDPTAIPAPRVTAVLVEGGSFVCECEGRPVGFTMASASGREPNLFALFVRPGFEGRGIGRRLLAMAEGWLKAAGVREARLSTEPDTRADRFYAEAGWERGSVGPDGEAVPHGRSVRVGAASHSAAWKAHFEAV